MAAKAEQLTRRYYRILYRTRRNATARRHIKRATARAERRIAKRQPEDAPKRREFAGYAT